MKSRVPIAVSLVTALLFMLVLSTASFIGSVKPAFATGTFYYDFESTLSPWQGKGDPGTTMSLSRESPTNKCPSDGSWAAVLSIDSSPSGHPSIWMYNSYSDSGSLSVTLDWQSRRVTEDCNNTLSPCAALAYVGTTQPTSGSDFTIMDHNIPLDGTWWPFHYASSITGNGTVYVAVGWRHVIGVRAPDAGEKVAVDCLKVGISANGAP